MFGGRSCERGRRARAEESGALHPSILGPDDVPLLPFRGGSGHASSAFLDHGREHARPAEAPRHHQRANWMETNTKHRGKIDLEPKK